MVAQTSHKAGYPARSVRALCARLLGLARLVDFPGRGCSVPVQIFFTIGDVSITVDGDFVGAEQRFSRTPSVFRIPMGGDHARGGGRRRFVGCPVVNGAGS